MEKHKPHCPLPIIQALVKEGKVHATKVAVDSAYILGFNLEEMISVVLSLTIRDFYKSMTTYADHKVWQDVYHPMTKAGKIYLKLMVIDEVVIMSFKEF